MADNQIHESDGSTKFPSRNLINKMYYASE